LLSKRRAEETRAKATETKPLVHRMGGVLLMQDCPDRDRYRHIPIGERLPQT
jgi:hypothetical protein